MWKENCSISETKCLEFDARSFFIELGERRRTFRRSYPMIIDRDRRGAPRVSSRVMGAFVGEWWLVREAGYEAVSEAGTQKIDQEEQDRNQDNVVRFAINNLMFESSV